MKKHLFLMAAIAATMSSCSQDEIEATSQTGEPMTIGFSTYATTTAKGASIETTADLEKKDIGVVAFHSTLSDPYMGYLDKGSKIVFNTAWNHFDVTESRYWPTDGGTLTFIAYTPYTDDARVVEPTFSKTNGITFTNYKVDSEVSKHADLMFDMNLNETQPAVGTNTNFTFKHALTQVNFIAKTKADNLFAEIAENGITLHNIGSVGNLSIPIAEPQVPEWSSVTTPTSYNLISEKSAVFGSSTGVNITANENSAMLLPQTLTPWDVADGDVTAQSGAYLSIKFKMYQATAADAATKTYVIGSAATDDSGYQTVYVPISSKDCSNVNLWEIGKSVSYTLTFGGGYDKNGNAILSPITFTAAIVPWNNKSNDVVL